MFRTLFVAATLCAMLAATTPLSAQDEPSFLELVKGIRDRLELVERGLSQDEVALTRYLRILEKLQSGARSLAQDAPMTRRDAAMKTVEESRAIAEEDPELESVVFETLDRCQVEAERDVIGESGPAAAARFLAETLKLEQFANDQFQRFLGECEQFKRLASGIEERANAHFTSSSQALQRLYILHAAALRARE